MRRGRDPNADSNPGIDDNGSAHSKTAYAVVHRIRNRNQAGEGFAWCVVAKVAKPASTQSHVFTD